MAGFGVFQEGVRGLRVLVGLGVALLLAYGIAYVAGLRSGLLYLTGIGLGLGLSSVNFGFTTGWRLWIESRDPQGMLAQFFLILLASSAMLPLIASQGHELVPAAAPLAWSMVFGALVFGAAMQLADGCGSGTLYKAGLGNLFSLTVLPGFVVGSFLGSLHLDFWLALGALPPVVLTERWGAGYTWLAQALVFGLLGSGLWAFRDRSSKPRWSWFGLFWAAVVLAVYALINLLLAGQPWGVVYGFGLWGAKIATSLGADLTQNAFWGREAQQAQIHETVLRDVTTLTNLGILSASTWMAWYKSAGVQREKPAERMRFKRILFALTAGLILGYSSRLAFGCNIGAYFSGIASGSLHGWIWFAAAFAGSWWFGVPLRRRWVGLQ